MAAGILFPPADVSDRSMTRLREIAAGKNLEAEVTPPEDRWVPQSSLPATGQDRETEPVEMCKHKEFNPDTGEWLYCGAEKHKGPNHKLGRKQSVYD